MRILDEANRNTVATARHFAANEPGAVSAERAGLLLVAAVVHQKSLFHSAARRIDP